MPYKNKEDQKAFAKQHYQKYKEYYKKKAKTSDSYRTARNYAFVNRYKLFCGCKHCGYKKHPKVLEFHHTSSDKDGHIANMVTRSGLVRIKKEIRKCVVLCANCHREEHIRLNQAIA